MVFKKGPVSRKRLAEFKAERERSHAEMLRRLREKALEDPAGVWAEMLEEALAKDREDAEVLRRLREKAIESLDAAAAGDREAGAK